MAPTNSNFLSSRWFLILLELVLCSFHIPPGVSGMVPIEQFHSTLAETSNSVCRRSASFDLEQRGQHCYLVYAYPVEVFGVFMVVRLYLFGRYLRSSSSLYSQWVAFIGSLNEINAMRPFFHFKALFKIRPMHLLVPLTLLNTFLTAAIIRILEQPVQPAFANYWKSVWLTAVTISGTGFGDYYPVTYLGRAFTTVSAMFGGVLLVALIQSLFFGVFELTPQEEKVKHLVDLHAWEKRTQENAARLIQVAWKLKKLQQQGDQSSPASRAALLDLYAAMRRARSLRQQRPSYQLSLEERVADMEHAVVTHLTRMEAEQAAILNRIQEKTKRLGIIKKELIARQTGTKRQF
ncbi:hypothetical protein P43SY_006999 [Pythium insidiosum]|uniref:Potassium channel domain-containing protein n=1 Tax=Pythium insidiosum TaxID=114742 RepID=A0AAD5LMC8_PYTIN|nr:hypothetical protein P43SY_006999 [Pythium insidiosum]